MSLESNDAAPCSALPESEEKGQCFGTSFGLMALAGTNGVGSRGIARVDAYFGASAVVEMVSIDSMMPPVPSESAVQPHVPALPLLKRNVIHPKITAAGIPRQLPP